MGGAWAAQLAWQHTGRPAWQHTKQPTGLSKGSHVTFGKKKGARGISFYFPEQIWAEWAALGRQPNLGRTAAPENEMIAANPYNTQVKKKIDAF